MYVDACVYMDGIHVYAGKGCPHRPESSDEMGEIKEPGWTCQSTPTEGLKNEHDKRLDLSE